MVSIRLEEWTTEPNAQGDNKESTVKYNLYAEVISNSGARSSLNGKASIKNQIQFKVRFRPGFQVTANWRVVYDGQRLKVTSIVKENEKRFYWIITASGD